MLGMVPLMVGVNHTSRVVEIYYVDIHCMTVHSRLSIR